MSFAILGEFAGLVHAGADLWARAGCKRANRAKKRNDGGAQKRRTRKRRQVFRRGSTRAYARGAALDAWRIVGSSLGLCVVVAGGDSGALLKMAPFNFLPEDDESQFSVSARAPEGTIVCKQTTAHRASHGRRKSSQLPGVDYTLDSRSTVSVNRRANDPPRFSCGLKEIGAREVSQERRDGSGAAPSFAQVQGRSTCARAFRRPRRCAGLAAAGAACNTF